MMSVFPVDAPRVDYSSLFHAGHGGVDIFAPRGSDVVAVAAGRARAAHEPKGGLAVYVVEPDGTQYFYGHLDEQVGFFPREVRAGELIGKLGDTGSALGRDPHVHFELRPAGGAKVDPVPYLNAVRNFQEHPMPAPMPPVDQSPASPLVRVPVERRSGGSSLLGLALLWWGLSRG